MKSNLLPNFLFRFISLGLVVLVALTACQQNRLEGATPYQLVPHNAIAIVQVNDFVELSPAFDNNKILRYWKDHYSDLESTLSSLTPSQPSSGDLYVFSPQGKETYATTYIGRKEKNDTLPNTNAKLKKYEGVQIHQSEERIFEATVGRLQLRSTTLLALENCIRNFTQNSNQSADPTFKNLKESLNNGSPVNLLIQPGTHALNRILLPEAPFIRNKINGWLAFDMEIEEPLEWDGIGLLNDSIANPMNWIQKLERKASELPKVAPEKMDAFFSFPVSNMAQLETNFRRFSQLQNMALKQVDLRVLSLVDELGWLRYRGQKALLMHLNSLENEFPLLAEKTNEKTYRGARYFKIRLPETISKLSKAFGQTQALQWSALVDNYVLFTESEELIKHIISNYRDGRVLDQNKAYQDLADTFSSRGSFLWVAATETLFDSKKFPSKSYPFVALQGVGETDFTHLHFRFGNVRTQKEQGRVVSTANFSVESPIALGPQWLKNHRTKGMDVVVQDVQNTLYLFSSQGNLYWKKDLKEPIIGPIQQVDLYKNKKWQMAFRTLKYLYILDRNGKEVKPFKIKLPASDKPLPLAIFDYDNNKNYRFVLAQDKRLLMYDKNGKRVKGFTRSKLKAPLIHPPKHARIKKKDYLLLQRNNGTLGILNRMGKDRIPMQQHLNFSGNQVYQYLDTFTTTDLEGNLVQIDTRGNIIKSPYELKPGHQIDATNKSLVTLSENNLNIKGIPVTLPYGNYTAPKIFYLNNTLYITTTDIESQKVYLYYSNATPVANFPVYGVEAADMSLDQKKKTQLVVAAENNGLLIYQINR